MRGTDLRRSPQWLPIRSSTLLENACSLHWAENSAQSPACHHWHSRVLCVAPTTRLKLSVKASKGQTCSTFLNIFLWSPCVIRPNMFLTGKVCALLSNLPTWFLLHFVLWCILAYLHTCQPRICWYKKVWQTQTWTAFSDIFKNTKTSGVHDYWGTHDLFWFMLHHFVHLAVAQIQQTWLNHKIMKFAFPLLLLPACSFTCWRHHRWVCKGFLLPTPAPWSFKYHHFVYGQFGTLHMPECHFLHAIGHSVACIDKWAKSKFDTVTPPEVCSGPKQTIW